MQFSSEQRLDDDMRERRFTVAGIPGILWTPYPSTPTPLVLLGPVSYTHLTLPTM